MLESPLLRASTALRTIIRVLPPRVAHAHDRPMGPLEPASMENHVTCATIGVARGYGHVVRVAISIVRAYGRILWT